jgi:Zn-dependent protease
VVYALRNPGSFGALAVGFLVAGLVYAAARAATARLLHEAALLPRPGRYDPRAQVDPFGVVGLFLGGIGWLRPLSPSPTWRPRRAPRVAVAMSGPVATMAAGVGAFLGYLALGGPGGLPAAIGLASELHGQLPSLTTGQLLLAAASAANLATAVLAAVPLPPLAGGDVLFTCAPTTIGWQRARHYLAEQNYGLVAVLVLLLLPIAGGVPPLLALVSDVCQPLLGALGGVHL